MSELVLRQKEKKFKVLDNFNKKKDYGISIRKQVADALGLLKKDQEYYLHDLILENQANPKLFRRSVKISAVQGLFKHMMNDGKKIGMIEEIAKKYANYSNMLCIGRGALEHIAKEAALKIKEISYIHAEGYSAAELKHGPLALIDENMPTLAMVASGPMEGKMLSNIREIKSRGGAVIGVVSSDVSKETRRVLDEIIEVPACSNKLLEPLLFLVPCQLFSYFLAKENGRCIDRPRNLAKSVTVE